MDAPAADSPDAEPIPAASSAGRRSLVGRVGAAIAACVVPAQFTYAALVSVAFVVFQTMTDKVGWVTMLAYGPRWLWLVPAVVLLILALLCRRSPAAAIITLGMVLGPVMGANVPYTHAAALRFAGPATHVRLMTFNVGQGSGMALDRARIRNAVIKFAPNVIVLQELGDVNLPTDWPGNWHIRHTRQPKGGQVVLIASRYPFEDRPPADSLRPSAVMAVSAWVRLGNGRGFWLVAPHIRSPRFGFNAVLNRAKNAWASLDKEMNERATQLTKVRGLAGASGDHVVIAGDFNTLPESPVLVAAMAGLRSAFNDVSFGYGNTKLEGGWGVRIDHVFTGGGIRATQCEVGPDLGSDHLPLIVDLNVGP